jgi:hypothetical protein
MSWWVQGGGPLWAGLGPSAEGDPFGLLGCGCHQLKLEKLSRGFLRGQFWNPSSESLPSTYGPSQFHLHRLRQHADLLSTHLTLLYYKKLYPNTVSTIPLRNSSWSTILYCSKRPKGEQHKFHQLQVVCGKCAFSNISNSNSKLSI